MTDRIDINALPVTALAPLKAVLDAGVAAMTASPGLSATLMMDDEAVTLVLSADVPPDDKGVP